MMFHVFTLDGTIVPRFFGDFRAYMFFFRKEKHLQRFLFRLKIFLVRKILETKLRRVDVSPGTSTVLSLSWLTVFWPFVMATEITCLSGQGFYMNEHRTRRQCRWVTGHEPAQIYMAKVMKVKAIWSWKERCYSTRWKKLLTWKKTWLVWVY